MHGIQGNFSDLIHGKDSGLICMSFSLPFLVPYVVGVMSLHPAYGCSKGMLQADAGDISLQESGYFDGGMLLGG